VDDPAGRRAQEEMSLLTRTARSSRRPLTLRRREGERLDVPLLAVRGALELRAAATRRRGPVVATIRPPENAVVLDALCLRAPDRDRRVFTSETDVLDRLGRVVRWERCPDGSGWDRRVIFVGPRDSMLLSLHAREGALVVRDAGTGAEHVIDPDAKPTSLGA
jgi:hypothetical protein